MFTCQKLCLGLVLAVAATLWVCTDAQAAEDRQPRKNNYSGYDGNASAMLDAINRDHKTPRRRSSSGNYGHGPTGRVERAPYESRKWYRNETGMIDAINRDHPPVYPRNR